MAAPPRIARALSSRRAHDVRQRRINGC